ncbi:MAG: glycosyltransferase [Solirubrobacterales bacterium]
MSAERLRILFSGMVAGDPHQGGASWAVLQYVAGLSELGHDVVLVEPVGAEALDPDGEVGRYFRTLPFLEARAALLERGGERTLGLPYPQLVEFARGADLLLNVSGMLRDERLLEAVPVRAFLDLDPGFNQVWQATGTEMGFDRHTHCVTVGVRIGAEDCPIPTLGRTWIPTLPPVALAHWLVAGGPPRREAFTSVGHWRSYGSIEHGGVHYGQRAHSLRRLFELPRRSGARFELALGIHPDEVGDLRALHENGWALVDPYEVAGTPEDYAAFVRESKAELGVAKSGYADSRSGWFSDRSACYLASGRPVVAQDTGFGEALPVGEGLLAFGTIEEAAAAVAAVEGDYERHARAARELAEEHLDSRKVLSRLLERLAVPEPSEASR